MEAAKELAPLASHRFELAYYNYFLRYLIPLVNKITMKVLFFIQCSGG